MLLSPLAHVEPAALASLGALARSGRAGSVPRPEPGHGVAVRGGVGAATTERLGGNPGARVYHHRPRRLAGGRGRAPAAHRGVRAARLGEDILRRRAAAIRRIQGFPLLPPSQVGGDAGQLRRTHLLVVSHGHVARRGADAGAHHPESGGAPAPGGGPRPPRGLPGTWRTPRRRGASASACTRWPCCW